MKPNDFADLGVIHEWEDGWGPTSAHPAQQVAPERLNAAWQAYTQRLTAGNYPFFHPRYAGQMLKPPHPVAVAGYLAAMTINPNNHALDGGPPTSEMEKEVVRDLAAMFGLPPDALGHLTSSGTIANLEALWVARQLQPGKKLAFSADAHYTHGRMAEVLGMDTVAIPTDTHGRMDLDALETVLKTGEVGTVVFTTGTTGLGAVDPLDDALPLRERYGVRFHVDAAYGGFFALLAHGGDGVPGDFPAAPFRAIAACDSVVVDPHKHGLQPYGCGCVLFRDPGVGRLYKHDSPYTYFTSDDLHLGEISLECSRAGAAAGALWLTLQTLPLTADGLGASLAAGLRAARDWHAKLAASEAFTPYVVPALDIVSFFPRAATASAIDAASQRLFHDAMHDPDDPVFLSVLRVPSSKLHTLHPDVDVDVENARVVRSVLMKPEHEHYVGHLHTAVERTWEAVGLGS